MQLTLFVNHACNLRCTYCYTGRKFSRPMPFDVARRAVDLGLTLADQGFLLLTFFGGEPLLELDLLERTVRYARERGQALGVSLHPGVATNGTLLDARRLRLLHDERFMVQLSLDGGPEAQDATRRFRNGKSSFARVEATLKTLLAQGFDPRVLAVIDPGNVAFLGPGFDQLMDLGARRIHYSPNYNGPWDEAACRRFEQALDDLGDRYMRRLRAGQDLRLDPLNGKIVTHLNRGYQAHNLCQFGQKEITVAPSGRIYPCDRLVAEDRGGEICIGDLDNGIDIERRDALVQAKNTPDPECSACELKPRCMFWCGCANYETTGHVGRVSPVVCWFERCFLACADRIANTLFEERCPAFLRRFYMPEAQFPSATD